MVQRLFFQNMRMGIWALTLAVPLGFGWTWYRSAELGDLVGNCWK